MKKQKSILEQEVGMTLLFLVGFASVRLSMIDYQEHIHITGDVIAMILVAIYIVIVTILYLASDFRSWSSFSEDSLLLLIGGCLVWNLQGMEKNIFAFAFVLCLTCFVAAIFKLLNLSDDNKQSVETRSLVLKGWLVKTIVFIPIFFGIEYLLIPFVF